MIKDELPKYDLEEIDDLVQFRGSLNMIINEFGEEVVDDREEDENFMKWRISPLVRVNDTMIMASLVR